jgi:hypothetical protein
MPVITSITNYKTSRDYELLFELMQKSSIICIVDFQGSRDVAQTLCGDGDYQISARGIGYLWADTREEFLEFCKMINVEFVVPTIEVKS